MRTGDAKAGRGRAAHQSGLAAEETVARFYEARGGVVLARRWRPPRGQGGEIDLVVRTPEALVFVEVKAGRAAAARDAITARQWARLEAAASLYIVSHETGDAAFRFDAAFVRPDGAVDLVENARETEAW